MERLNTEKELAIIRKRMRLYRLEKGYSQEYMGFSMGVSQYAYGKIENGDTKLSISALLKIEHILGIEKWKLITG